MNSTEKKPTKNRPAASLGSLLTNNPVTPRKPAETPRRGPVPGAAKKQIAAQIDAGLVAQFDRVAHWDRHKKAALLEMAIRLVVEASANRDRLTPQEEEAAA